MFFNVQKILNVKCELRYTLQHAAALSNVFYGLYFSYGYCQVVTADCACILLIKKYKAELILNMWFQECKSPIYGAYLLKRRH